MKYKNTWETAPGKYSAEINETEYHDGRPMFISRLFGTGIPADTNYHKSLAAAKAYVGREISGRGSRLTWAIKKDQNDEGS